MAKSYIYVITGTENNGIKGKQVGYDKYKLENSNFLIPIEKFAVVDFLYGATLYEDEEFIKIDKEGNFCCTDMSVPIKYIDFIGIQ